MNQITAWIRVAPRAIGSTVLLFGLFGGGVIGCGQRTASGQVTQELVTSTIGLPCNRHNQCGPSAHCAGDRCVPGEAPAGCEGEECACSHSDCLSIDSTRPTVTPNCAQGDVRPCGLDEGICQPGEQICHAGQWSTCLGSINPREETCNGLDDDCDGEIPAGEVDGDGDGFSQCNGDCDDSDPTVFPGAAELCDGVDNDCEPNTVDGAAVLRVPAITTCGTSWDRRPILEFDPLPEDHRFDILTNGSVLDSVDVVGTNHFRPASPIGSGSPPPGNAIELGLRACTGPGALGSGIECCADTSPVSVILIEECTQAIPATADNVLISEYVADGDGSCPGGNCEAGEAFELTNLSHCPVSLDGNHFSYCNQNGCNAKRWMNFDASVVVPPRGVYVAIRNIAPSQCDYPFMGANDPQLFGLLISTLTMESDSSLTSGWFNNSGGGRLRVATGPFTSMDVGQTFATVDPYSGAADSCESIGFNAFDACGNVDPTSISLELLEENQLGRLWHPCDAVADPYPACLD